MTSQISKCKKNKVIKEGSKNDMSGFKEFIVNNLPWIITTLLAIGAFAATIKFQGDKLNDAFTGIGGHENRIDRIESAIVKIDEVQNDVKDIKEDIREIRSDIKCISKNGNGKITENTPPFAPLAPLAKTDNKTSTLIVQ